MNGYGELERSIEELTWLNGTYNLSHRNVQRIQAEIAADKDQLDKLELVDSKSWDESATIGDVEALSGALNDVQSRVALLNSLKESLERFSESEHSFQTDDTVLSEHLFRMQVLISVLDNLAANQAEDVPELVIPQPNVDLVNHEELLKKNRAPIAIQLAETLGRRDTIGEEIQASLETQSLLSRMKIRWERERDLIAQAEDLDQELRDLNPEALLARFQAASEATANKAEALNGVKDEYGRLSEAEQGLAARFQAQPDPFRPLIAPVSKDYYDATRARFYTLAGLDITSSSTTGGTDIEDTGMLPIQTVAQDIKQFRQTLSTQLKNLEERSQIKTDWLGALKALQQKGEELLTIQNELRTLALERYVVAVELKKRLGRQELANDAIPNGLTDALQREQIRVFEKEANAVLEIGRFLSQKIDEVSEPDTTEAQRHDALTSILNTIGIRSDLENDQSKLAQTVSAGEKALSDTQLKTRKQEAIRLLESGTSIRERFLSFIPSNRAQGLWELMLDHYQETLELEGNRTNLHSQSDITEKLIESITEEQSAVTQLLTVQRARLEQLQNERILGEKRLQDKLQEHSVSSSEKESGASAEIAQESPNFTAQEVDAMTQSAQKHFEAEVLCGKWIELLEERLSLRGLAAELARFQQKLGTIQIQVTSNERRLAFLRGGGKQTSDAAAAEAGGGQNARQSGGEIRVLRGERQEILEGEVIWALGRMASIVIGTMILLFMVNRISAYRLRKAEEREASAHTFFVLSFFKTILKLTIWVVAALLLFSVLGFQVGTILAGLGIGGLAVAMAARETLANILGGIMIFFEKPFSIGDVVKIGPNTARVVGMTWRTTRLKTPFGYSICVPNSQATESMIKNFSHTDPPGDYFLVYISAKYDPQKVIPVMNKAIGACKTVLADQAIGTWVAEGSQMGSMTVMAYWPWWSIKDYGKRNATRNEVWQSIWTHLNDAGIEMEVRPFHFEGIEPIQSAGSLQPPINN